MSDVTVDDIDRLRRISGLPVLVKGVLRADDASACLEAGAAGVAGAVAASSAASADSAFSLSRTRS